MAQQFAIERRKETVTPLLESVTSCLSMGSSSCSFPCQKPPGILCTCTSFSSDASILLSPMPQKRPYLGYHGAVHVHATVLECATVMTQAHANHLFRHHHPFGQTSCSSFHSYSASCYSSSFLIHHNYLLNLNIQILAIRQNLPI
jgi:hypothetical protein